jgi:clan AA aspartic protease (TIGR02281 family)
MFGRVVFVATLCVAAALLGSFSLLERMPGAAPVAAGPASAAVPTAAGNAVAEEGARRQVFSYREIALRADGRGQYTADTLVNGMPVRMLVDTGASDVIVSAATAARLGLVGSERRRRTIQTANGQSSAMSAVLTHVSFGGLYMNDVEALILAPEAGEVNLLGESFLKRLVSVEQRDGMLILRQ